jgi:S-methylmethionine-dependent homocysteine/selenocysteine methylase
MNFETCYTTSSAILMEGAIGERLKREFGIPFDDTIALAGHIYNAASKKAMLDIFGQYLSIAEKYRLPFMATTPTRRANRERVRRSKYSETIIHDNVRFLLDIKSKAQTPMFIGGLMGCKGDAYKATDVLSEKDALEFHSWQAGLFTKAGVDFLYAAIMPALSESIGMAKALENTGLPYIISFMIRNNGRLVDGTIIHDAIAAIDSATVKKPICYMTNCVHPTTLKDALTCLFNRTDLVKDRFRGIQANTSMLPPEELDKIPIKFPVLVRLQPGCFTC